MNNERYHDITSSIDTLEYKFTSVGKNGKMEKHIQYRAFHASLSNIYNLGFGHLMEDGKSIDDCVRADNGDMEKVLSTVAFTIYDFTSRYPDRTIYLRGSDPVRTRIYQIAINKHYDEITADYELYGHAFVPETENSKERYYNEPFQKNKNYIGFLITRK